MTHRLATSFVAVIAALTLSGSVASAAVVSGAHGRARATLAGHPDGKCSDVYGRWWADAALAATTRQVVASQPDEAVNEDADDQGEDADEQGEDTNAEPSDGARPHNHGWYVSQAAHDKSTTGADHGKAVSAVAHGDDGKSDSSGGD